MVNSLNILVVSTNNDITTVLMRLIDQQKGWNAYSVVHLSQIEEMVKTQSIKIVLLCSGYSKKAETQLITSFEKKHPNVAVIKHYGGGSGLLYNEISHALNEQKTTLL